jgi:DNA polymerase IV (DinB-like DNA polymerase)
MIKVMKTPIILHIDMDYFFAQVEERENPQFKRKPIIVGADPKKGKGRGVVSSANYQARKYGIHSALPISKAFELCPQAIFLPVNMELYQKTSQRIMAVVKKYSPQWEIVSLDEAYLDISFLGSYQKAENLAKKLKKEIFEKERLTSTIGIGQNKLIAKMAAEKAKPNGLLIIEPNQVKKFLEPLEIEDLPGIGPKTAMKIAQTLSLRSRDCGRGPIRIKDLKKLSEKELVDLLGVVGKTIYQRARGIDKNPIISKEIRKSIGKEHTFEKDTRDPEIIFGTFEKIIKDIHQELLKNKFSPKTITVICRYQDFETHSKSKTIKGPTNDFEILKREAKKLLLKFMIENPKLIRLIGFRLKR